jgi:hypothetical protein
MDGVAAAQGLGDVHGCARGQSAGDAGWDLGGLAISFEFNGSDVVHTS